MTTIVVILLIIVVHIVGTFKLGQQRTVMAFTFVEFFASRGFQMLFDGLRTVAVDDSNLILKQHYHLLFARDVVGMTWVGFASIIIAVYIFILWKFLKAPYAVQKVYISP
jgi:predicted CDP-diglyceride synthetase/phosphatidate cytidylyltransferase